MDAFFFYLENLRKESLNQQTGSVFLRQSADLYFHLLGTQKPLPQELIDSADALIATRPEAPEDHFHYLWLLNARARYSCFIEKNYEQALDLAARGLRHSEALLNAHFDDFDLEKKAYPLVTALVFARIFGYQEDYRRARDLMQELLAFIEDTTQKLPSFPDEMQTLFSTHRDCFRKILSHETNRTYFRNKIQHSLSKLSHYENRKQLKTLWQTLESLAAAPTQQKAFIDADTLRSLTWQETRNASQNLAAEILRHTTEKSFVLICTGQNLLFPVSLFACWAARVTPLLISEDCTALEFQRICKVLGENPTLLLLDSDLPADKKERIAGFSKPLFVTASQLNVNPADRQISTSPSELALGIFTSGTSDLPKLILFTHENLYRSAQIEFANEPILDQAIVANLRPHFTSGGLNTLWPGLLGKTCHVFSDKIRRRPIARYLQDFISKYNLQLLITSPAYLQSLSESLEDTRLSSHPLPTYFGGMSLDEKTVLSLSQKGLHLFMRYGMTEVGHILCKIDASTPRATQSVGPAFSNFHIKSHNRYISVCSPGVADFKMREGRLVPLRVGEWFPTEDQGEVTNHHEVLLQGREHSIICVDGFRFHARQVESTIMNLAEVKECCAVGVPDPRHGQQLIAFVVARESVSANDEENLKKSLQLFLQQNISAPLRPSKYIFMAELPRMPNGKIHFSELKARAERKD